ncbi:MAG: hypothetical protein KatS3mg011_1133 [Acidimicrobiia bacterium]|jgi:hypothetical protein|nr:MAG: hypothetical protein KatS3mg011_1133 [Acidimicrobiia bacterium]
MRLTPPTTSTFTLAVLAVVAGVGIRLGWVSVLEGYDFWLVTAGAFLLIIGVLFRRL